MNASPQKRRRRGHSSIEFFVMVPVLLTTITTMMCIRIDVVAIGVLFTLLAVAMAVQFIPSGRHDTR